MEQEEEDFIGKRVSMWMGSDPRPVRVEVIRIDHETRRAIKFRAVYRRDGLGKIGFMQEGDQWVIGDIHICRN